jgi:hypothetical protein
MNKILAALLLTLLAAPAVAGPGCQSTSGGSITLEKVRQNATGPELFGCLNRSFDIISSSSVPTHSTTNWLVEGRIDVSTIGATQGVPAIYFSSGVRVGAGAGLSVDYGFTAATGTFTGTGNTTYSLTTSSGAQIGSTLDVAGAIVGHNSGAGVYSAVLDSGVWVRGGTLLNQGSGGSVVTYGLTAGTGTFTATGNTTYSLTTSSGATFGSDVHVTGTLEATKLKGDGSQITGIGGGGTVTTQGSPAAGDVPMFQSGTVISSSPYKVSQSSAYVVAAANFTMMVASGAYTNVTTASVTLPSGYSSYFVTGRLQNTNASARTAVLNLGGDFGSNYGWALLNDYVASTEHVGCDPSKWVGMTDSTSGTNRLAASAWLSFSCTVDVASASVMLWNCTATASNNDVSQMNHLTFGGIYRGSASVAGFSMSSGLSTCTTVPVPSASSVSGTIRVFGLP